MDSRTRTAAVLLIGALALIYLPDVGHGFIRDDFMWLRAGRIGRVSDVGRLLTGNVGFYRPVVTASFAIDYALFALSPFPYALTNCGLLLVCAALLARLGRALGLTPVFAFASAALWAFNFHGVNMALLWISGRTALLLCMFALLATLASMRQRWWRVAGWSLLAVLSKEEAVVLPFMLVLWVWYSGGDLSVRSLARTARRAAPVFAALAVYFLLRLNSDAFGPLDAPDYYRPTFSPALLLRNAVEYLDRAASVPAAVVLLACLAVRGRPSLSADDPRTLRFCGLWFVAWFALTVFLPLRSSLYAIVPSAGSCLAGGVILQAVDRARPARMRGVLRALVVLPFLWLPVYRSRNERWVAPADMSRLAVRDLQAMATVMRPGGHVVAIDSPDDPDGLTDVFDGLFSDAVTLYVGDGSTGEIGDPSRPPPLERERNVAVLRFVGGRLRHEAWSAIGQWERN